MGEAAGNDPIEKKVVTQFHNETAQMWTQCGVAEATNRSILDARSTAVQWST